MKIKEALIWSKKRLEKEKSKSRALEAEIILAYVLKKNKEYLYTYPEKELNKKEAAKLKKLIRRKLRGWPIPYLIAEWEFFGLNFFVNPKVLIPRAETELIVEYILENYKPVAKLQILDMGTGSGCIAVALGKLFPYAKITAVDISAEALKIAKLNAKNNKVKNI
ncbi:MAG: HemK/PrmC family methyltransferase, partial [Patescibacteria group bacterium]